MTGRYSRTYSRKKAAAPPISQFDKLLSEHGKSTHPVASKTAGHVGKWGMTSFTSLRSITESYGKEDPGKRSWLDSPPGAGTGDSLSTQQSSNEVSKVAPPKRRKFFKSRECSTASVPPTPPCSSSFESSSPDSKALSTNQSQEEESGLQMISQSTTIASCIKNKSDVSQTKGSKVNSLLPLKPGGSGGIKLKIFKSRNNDLNSCGTYSSTVQLPSDDSENSSNSSSITDSPRSDPMASAAVSGVHSPNGLVLCDPLSTVPEGNEDPVESAVENPVLDSLSLNSDLKLVNCNLDEKWLSPSSCNLDVSEYTDANQVQPSSAPSDEANWDETNKAVIVQDTSPPELDRNGAVNDCESESACDRTFSDAKETEEEFDCDQLTYKGSKSLCSKKSKKSQIEKDVDLFSSDFDENEIVDRTSIDYPSSSMLSFSDIPLTRSNTIDLDELETLSSVPNLRSNSFAKTLSQSRLESKASLSKKKSIFKSRQKEGDIKTRATYKHKWHGHEEKEDNFKAEELVKSSSLVDNTSGDPFEFETIPVLKRVQTWPSSAQSVDDSMIEETLITSVKCPKQSKKYYTVIKNVKKTHQLQESGEFQEFNDDVEYFLDALRSSNSISTRCLASLNLAQKCMTPAFRMHLRAHATVIKFFRALSDAPSHPHLAECAAMVMFALSQDRLNMDLDRGSLELMLNLLDTDSNLNDSSHQLADPAADHGTKIRILCKELQQKGHAKHLKLDNIKAATLAMETLLSLTSKRAGEWFKEELRELGGVDHLIRTVTSYCKLFRFDIQIWTSSLLDKLSKIDRCLKVLENVTHQNESNQEYLLCVNDGEFARTLMLLFRMCHSEVSLNPMTNQETLLAPLSDHNPAASKGIVTTLITTIKVLINLTHGSRKEALGSQVLGQDEEMYNISIYCLLIMPMYLDHDTKFEIQVLACCLLLNLVENSPDNRRRLMDLSSPVVGDEDDDIFANREREGAMASLVSLFYTSEESARIQEAHTDQIIDKDLVQETKEDDKKDEDIEETVARLLQKAGRHMEDTLIAAYTALLAGYCIMDNKDFEEKIRYLQPEGHFKTMVAVLKKFLHFMNLTATTSLLRSLKPTERVVKYMECLDRTPEEEAEEIRKKEEAAQALAFDAFGF